MIRKMFNQHFLVFLQAWAQHIVIFGKLQFMLCTMADIHDGRYLLNKAIKLKGIEKLAYIEGHLN